MERSKSPAFNPPSYPLEPDNQILRVPLAHTEWGYRTSQQPSNIKNGMTIKQLKNGQ